MVEYVCRTARFCAMGNEILQGRIVMPRWEEYEKISAFYREIAERALAFCESGLRARAQAEFDEVRDAGKQASFAAFRYRLDAHVTYENTQVASVRLEATLSRCGKGESIQRFFDAHVWELSSQTLLPPIQALRCFSDKRVSRRLCKGADGILFDGEGLFLCRKGRLEPLREQH